MAAMILTAIIAVFSVLAYAKVVGLENSTHKLEYVRVPEPQFNPIENPDAQTGNDLLKAFAGDEMRMKQPE